MKMKDSAVLGTLYLYFELAEGMTLIERSSGQKWIWPAQTLGAAKLTKSESSPAPFCNDTRGKSGMELVPAEGWNVYSVTAHSADSLQVEMVGLQGKISQHWMLTIDGLTV